MDGRNKIMNPWVQDGIRITEIARFVDDENRTIGYTMEGKRMDIPIRTNCCSDAF
jgi:hypothetical protein